MGQTEDKLRKVGIKKGEIVRLELNVTLLVAYSYSLLSSFGLRFCGIFCVK